VDQMAGVHEDVRHVRAVVVGSGFSGIEFVDELPRTSTGKVRKNELRDIDWAFSDMRIRG
jgi:fatty-acyl-CoA synthase